MRRKIDARRLYNVSFEFVAKDFHALFAGGCARRARGCVGGWFVREGGEGMLLQASSSSMSDTAYSVGVDATPLTIKNISLRGLKGASRYMSPLRGFKSGSAPHHLDNAPPPTSGRCPPTPPPPGALRKQVRGPGGYTRGRNGTREDCYGHCAVHVRAAAPQGGMPQGRRGVPFFSREELGERGNSTGRRIDRHPSYRGIFPEILAGQATTLRSRARCSPPACQR